MNEPILPAVNLPREARALLIAIAQGESDPVAAKEGISPYFILVGGGSFEGMPNRQGYSGFPQWSGRQFSTGISHAAGRYQFQPGTWRDTVEMFPADSKPDFRNRGDQDWGGWLLAQRDYKMRTNRELMGALRAGDVKGIGDLLRPTWASMSNATFPARYAAALAVVPTTEPLPQPSPTPTPPPTEPPPVTNPIATILAASRFQDGVQAFQKANGLIADGVIGPLTLLKIGEQMPAVEGEAVDLTLADIIDEMQDSLDALKELAAQLGETP